MKIKSVKSIGGAAKPKTNMKDRFRGITFCLLWYLSILVGFFLMVCPIIPLVIISPKTYRRWTDLIIGIWEVFPVAMLEVFLGVRVVLSGDNINPFESALFVMNHRTRVDWGFLWLGLFHCCKPNAHNMKYVLKAPIMHLPGIGWVMQACSFIFVHRNWEMDKPLLDIMMDYLNNSDQLYQVLIFPEGTDLSENNIKKSHKYADEHNLERYYNVLHPRTTGFAFLVHKMKAGGQLRAVYDVTIGYPKTMPYSETDLLRGIFPEEVHFHVKRYASILIPYQEEELKNWLNDIWRQKEKKLEQFYCDGFFTNREEDNVRVDFGSLNLRNGALAIKNEDDSNNVERVLSNSREITVDGITSLEREASLKKSDPASAASEKRTASKNYLNCENVYRSKNYRPSHLLYLILGFWLILIAFITYELFFNIYMQIWVLVHSLFFVGLSFVSNGFHQIAASIYFYRYKRKPYLIKKAE